MVHTCIFAIDVSNHGGIIVGTVVVIVVVELGLPAVPVDEILWFLFGLWWEFGTLLPFLQELAFAFTRISYVIEIEASVLFGCGRLLGLCMCGKNKRLKLE